MTKSDVFEEIYNQSENGLFDIVYYELGNGDKVGLDVVKLTNACKTKGVDIDTFLKYARNRKNHNKYEEITAYD